MADYKFLVNIDLDQNELKNATLHPLATFPVATGEDGQLYYNTGDQLTYQYKAGAVNAWEVIGGSGTTNITDINYTGISFDIASSSGTNATLEEPTVSNAGILSAANWVFLEALRVPTRTDDDPDEIVLHKNTNLLINPLGTQTAWFLDEDNFASDSDTKVASQQSIKAYVDSAVSGGVTYKGGFDPTGAAGAGIPALNTITSVTGDMYTVTVAGTYNWTTGSAVLEVGDVLIAESDGILNNVTDWTIVQKNETGVVSNVSGAGTDLHLTMFDTDGNNIQDAGFLASDVILASTLASETVKGIVEEATQTEVNDGTDTGTTGAQLFVAPSKLAAFSGLVNRYELSLPATATTNVPHLLNNRFVTAEVYKSATPYERVGVVIECLDADNLTVKFNTAPAADEYTIVVIG